MSTIAEFIEVRKSIETLAAQIIVFAERKAVQDSRQHLDKANQQLELLKTMVANDVQVIVASRLSKQLAGLEKSVEKIKAKTPIKKATAKNKQQKAL